MTATSQVPDSADAQPKKRRAWLGWVIVVGGLVLAFVLVPLAQPLLDANSRNGLGEYREVSISGGSDDVKANIAVTDSTIADAEWAEEWVTLSPAEGAIVHVTGYEWKPVEGEATGDPIVATVLSGWVLELEDGTTIRDVTVDADGCSELGFRGCAVHFIPEGAETTAMRLTGVEGYRSRSGSVSWSLEP